jgi:Flp pilus assembly protein TadG
MKMLRDQRGVASLEFCVIAMVLFGIMLAVFDFGNVEQRQIALHQALRSGGEFARFFPTTPGANGAGSAPCSGQSVRCAVLNALPSSMSLSSLTIACTCAGANVSCGSPGTCNPPFLVKISAAMSPISIMTPLWTGGAFTNQGSYEVRIQ